MDDDNAGLDELIEMVSRVSAFMDDNLQAQFQEVMGAAITADDDRLDILAMFVIAHAALRRIAGTPDTAGVVSGDDAEKLQWTTHLVGRLVGETLESLAGGATGKTGWSGPEDEDLLSFAYSAISATQVNGLAVALDAIAESGIDRRDHPAG